MESESGLMKPLIKPRAGKTNVNERRVVIWGKVEGQMRKQEKWCIRQIKEVVVVVEEEKKKNSLKEGEDERSEE